MSNQWPQILFVDQKTKASVVKFIDDKIVLKIPGAWNDNYIELYRKYRCSGVWIYALDGSGALEKVLEIQLTDSLQLMGGFSNIGLVEEAKVFKSFSTSANPQNQTGFI